MAHAQDIKPSNVFQWLVARLSSRPDTEHELTLSRLALSMIAFLALFIGFLSGSVEHRHFLEEISIYFIAFTASTLFLFAHLLWQPGVSRFRRYLGIPIDVGCVAYLMHLGDELTAFTYPIFLWAIFGNGFRFGVKYLFVAALFGFCAFLAVIATTPFWRDNRELSAGLLLALIILPVYVSVLIRRLSEAKRQAEEASRAKSLFLASLSHELRTPLNAVIGLSDMLVESKLDLSQSEMARTIGKSGRSLLGLINSLLDLSRMEIGSKPQMMAFDLHELLRDIRAMLDVQAKAKDIELILHIYSDVPNYILGSMRHFEEVLINLAGNAIKFTSRGYVQISVRLVSQTEENLRLRFDVSDTGIGIAPEAQARIFESFTQADETIIDRFGGTGLGLSIARQLVHAHAGEIGVQSALGRGSTFWFEMNVGRAEAPSVESKPVVKSPHRRLQILLAEDNRTNQMVIQRILEQGGHDVMTVDHGDAAVDCLMQEKFDLVLMDLNMPVMNGLEASKFYTFAMLGVDRAPIVALTADVTDEAARKCQEAGMVACLNKPIEAAALLEAVARYARQEATHGEIAAPMAAAMSAPKSAPISACLPGSMPSSSILDARALHDLEKLGGKLFVREIATQFIQDADGVMKHLRDAVQHQDVFGFRDHAHALRSCAANVGAQAIFQRCLMLRSIEAEELACNGQAELEALEAELAAARAALQPHVHAA